VGLYACPNGSVVTPPTGEAYRYIGSVTGNDNADAPLPADKCHYVATLNPKTGPLGAVGLALENAAILAVKELNEARIIDGKSICLISGDTRTDPEFARQLTEEILQNYPVVAINGAAASSASTQVAAYLQTLRESSSGTKSIPQISCCSTSPVLSSTVGNDAYFQHVLRTAPSDALQGLVLARLVRQQRMPPAQKMSVIFIDDVYGQALTAVFEKEFVALGGQLLHKVPFQPGAPAYFDAIELAMKDGPDHILLVAFPGDGAQIMRDWHTSGLGKDVRWLATDGLRADEFVQGTGLATSRFVVGTVPVLTGPHFTEFSKRYSSMWSGEAPGVFTSNQFDAIMLIGLGIARRAAPGNTEDLSAAIRTVSGGEAGVSTVVSLENLREGMEMAQAGANIDYEGASGTVDIDGAGDVLSSYRVWSVGTRGSIVDTECNWTCTREVTDECVPDNQENCRGL